MTTTALFSARWASALGDALAASTEFRTAARGWSDAVILEWSDAPIASSDDHIAAAPAVPCGVFLDMHDGACRVARIATADDYASARYVLSAPLSVWQQMLKGQLAPTMAILRGKLTLTKGSVAALMPHVQAASTVVRVAMELERGLAVGGNVPVDAGDAA